jgi:hypothetical protein
VVVAGASVAGAAGAIVLVAGAAGAIVLVAGAAGAIVLVAGAGVAGAAGVVVVVVVVVLVVALPAVCGCIVITMMMTAITTMMPMIQYQVFLFIPSLLAGPHLCCRGSGGETPQPSLVAFNSSGAP